MKKKNTQTQQAPKRESDGRTFVTVYMSKVEHAKLKKHVEKLEESQAFGKVGISTFMRVTALKAIGAR